MSLLETGHKVLETESPCLELITQFSAGEKKKSSSNSKSSEEAESKILFFLHS